MAPQNPQDGTVCQGCGDRLRLHNRYLALKPLGEGGFGRTFLAVDAGDPRQPACVIKQFFPQQQNKATPQKAAALFHQEAQRLQALGQHAQIPALFADLEQDGRQYLIQEFIDGRNLEQELAEQGTFSEAQIRELLLSLLPVLRFIHQHQVIHRDIKPANIIRQEQRHFQPQTAGPRGVSEPCLFLVDLGAAKQATGATLSRTGTVIGSAEFTAPEQARGRATFASDLYSLGVTCVYLFTGVSPFDLYDTGEGCWVWRDYLQQPISPALGQILDRLLEPATRRRYGDVEEVWSDLVGNLEPAAPRPSPVASVSRSHPPVAATAAAVGVDLPRRPVALPSPPVEPAAIAPTAPLPMPEPVGPAAIAPRPPQRYLLPLLGLLAVGVLGAGIWVAQSGQVASPPLAQTPRSLQMEPDFAQLAFGPDDQSLVIAGSTAVHLWDLPRQQVVQRWENAQMAVRLGGASDPLQDVWRSEGQILQQLNPLDGTSGVRIAADTGALRNFPLIISGNGQVLVGLSGEATSAGMARTIAITAWETQTGRLINRFETQIALQHPHPQGWFELPVALSPDGKGIAIARHSTPQINAIEIRDLRSYNLLHSLRTGPSPQVPNRALFSGDGKILVVLTTGDRGTVLEVWDLASDELKLTLPVQPGHHSFQMTATGDRLIALHPSAGIQVWDLASGQIVRTIHASTGATTLAISPDGFTLAWLEGSTVRITDLRTGTRLRSFEGVPTEHPESDTILLFSADARRLASRTGAAGRAAIVRIWTVF